MGGNQEWIGMFYDFERKYIFPCVLMGEVIEPIDDLSFGVTTSEPSPLTEYSQNAAPVSDVHDLEGSEAETKEVDDYVNVNNMKLEFELRETKSSPSKKKKGLLFDYELSIV